MRKGGGGGASHPPFTARRMVVINRNMIRRRIWKGCCLLLPLRLLADDKIVLNTAKLFAQLSGPPHPTATAAAAGHCAEHMRIIEGMRMIQLCNIAVDPLKRPELPSSTHDLMRRW